MIARGLPVSPYFFTEKYLMMFQECKKIVEGNKKNNTTSFDVCLVVLFSYLDWLFLTINGWLGETSLRPGVDRAGRWNYCEE